MEKQRDEIAEILAKNFTLYDGVTTFCAGDFEWCAYQLMENGYRKERQGEWLSAYEYALKLGNIDENRLEQLKQDKIWKFCTYCEQQVNGYRNYCPNCGAKMRGE